MGESPQLRQERKRVGRLITECVRKDEQIAALQARCEQLESDRAVLTRIIHDKVQNSATWAKYIEEECAKGRAALARQRGE